MLFGVQKRSEKQREINEICAKETKNMMLLERIERKNSIFLCILREIYKNAKKIHS